MGESVALTGDTLNDINSLYQSKVGISHVNQGF